MHHSVFICSEGCAERNSTELDNITLQHAYVPGSEPEQPCELRVWLLIDASDIPSQTGTLPSSYSKLEYVSTLKLSYNQFHGTVIHAALSVDGFVA
jgi:hypothetical protein